MSRLLISERPLQVLPVLATEIGLNEAIFVQQLHYWLTGKSAKERDGKRWVYNTYEGWQENFPFWSVSTIRRTINSCIKQNFIITGNYNKLGIDKTKWYSINYEEINRVSSPSVQNEQTICSKWTAPSVQNGQTITIDYPETTTESIKNPPTTEEKPVKSKYGEFKNVLLTDEELAKLKEKFPKDLQERIERLSLYIESQGKKYKSHYATILSWARRDEQQQTKQPTKEYDYF